MNLTKLKNIGGVYGNSFKKFFFIGRNQQILFPEWNYL
jgi:hypothetical protein